MTAAQWSLGALGPLLAKEEAQEGDWRDRGLCAETDPEAFFPEKGGSTRDAKRVCRSCEVSGQCLQYALENDERFGIWGGKSERERRTLKRAAGTTSPADVVVRLTTEKPCTGRCGQVRPVSDFASRTRAADGRTSRCRDCQSADDRDRRIARKAIAA